MEKRMATAEPKVSQRAMRKRSGSGESMNTFSIRGGQRRVRLWE